MQLWKESKAIFAGELIEQKDLRADLKIRSHPNHPLPKITKMAHWIYYDGITFKK